MLTLVATPIGRTDEITLRSLELFKNAQIIVCESTKEASKLLKAHQIKALRYEVLDEHSTPEDVNELVQLCADQNVVLVSDCGTPSFCDPGFQLVKACRQKGYEVRSSLGASSLMGLLSLSSERLNQFYFRGFIPAENIAREKEWQQLKKFKEAFVLMDTPYRLKKTLDECALHLPKRKMLLVTDLSQDTETQIEGTCLQVRDRNQSDKAEFMILVYPESVI